MTTHTETAVESYVNRVRAALADLPDSEIEEILEDVGPHLVEIADELGDDTSIEALTRRLGTPERYAEELRSAAGYQAARPDPAENRILTRAAAWGIAIGAGAAFCVGFVPGLSQHDLLFYVPFAVIAAGALALVVAGKVTVGSVLALAECRAARRAAARMIEAMPVRAAGYLRSLQPAWWLVRVVVLIVGAVLAVYPHRRHTIFVLLPIVALVVLLWFGTKSRTERRWLWLVVPGNAFAIGLGLAMAVTVWTGVGSMRDTQDGYGASYYQHGLFYDGNRVSNVYPFDANGKWLAGVYLYDEKGQPIGLSASSTCVNSLIGEEKTNQFPLPTVEYERGGRCGVKYEVPFTVVIPRSSTDQPATVETTQPTDPTSAGATSSALPSTASTTEPTTPPTTPPNTEPNTVPTSGPGQPPR